jgi:hypothetical protein
MRRRACAGVLLALLVGAAPARGADDPVVARDTYISGIWALDGIVVYSRSVGARPTFVRPWMRIVSGRVLVARGIIGAVREGDVGLDRSGHVVIPFVRSGRWWIYDVVADRAHRLRGRAANAGACSRLAIWRRRLAYTDCHNIYLRIGSHTRRVPDPYPGVSWRRPNTRLLLLRGARLAAEVLDPYGDAVVYLNLFADASGYCKHPVRLLGASYGDENTYDVQGASLSGRYITWTMGGGLVTTAPAGNPLLGARLTGHCHPTELGWRPTGPDGLLFMPPPDTGTMTVDDPFAYYANDTTIRRHRLPATPSDPQPPNDNFDNAIPLSGDPPLTVTGVLGGSTIEPAETAFTPAGTPNRTVWYAFHPTTTGLISVSVTGIYAMSLAFYTGPSINSLTFILPSHPGVAVPVAAGHTYWIQVGTRSAIPDFRTFTLTLRPTPRARRASPNRQTAPAGHRAMPGALLLTGALHTTDQHRKSPA